MNWRKAAAAAVLLSAGGASAAGAVRTGVIAGEASAFATPIHLHHATDTILIRGGLRAETFVLREEMKISAIAGTARWAARPATPASGMLVEGFVEAG
jgi:hypothetical protein